MKYVITGATGGLGSQVFKYLLRLVPSSDIVVSLYNPQGASAEIVESGVEIRHGNFSDPETLDSAFRGAEKLLIVSYPSIAHQLRVQNHKNAIDAAKRCEVKHIYYTSLAFGTGSVAAVMGAHLDTEAYLKASGVTYTIVREGIYSESWPLYLGFWSPQNGDEVLVPHGDGGIAWVTREDLGEGTARLIVGDEHQNETLLLSGSHSWTLRELTRTISELLNRDIHLKIVSEDEYVQNNLGKRGPRGEEEFLRAWATTYHGLVRGELDAVDPLLEKILGRKLKPMEETLREMLQDTIGSGGTIEQYAK